MKLVSLNLAELKLILEVQKCVGAMEEQHAAARGLVDAIVTPENLRYALQLALETRLNTDKPRLGAFILPENL